MKPCWPTTEGLAITSTYGWRIHPITGLDDFHAAIDISGGGVERPIYATQHGVVYNKGFNSGLGYFIVIAHSVDDFFSRYSHLKELPSIDIGMYVSRCQEIATMGTTGSSTGIHLDFAIATKANGFNTEEFTIDPLVYLDTDFDNNNNYNEIDLQIVYNRRFIRRRR